MAIRRLQRFAVILSFLLCFGACSSGSPDGDDLGDSSSFNLDLALQLGILCLQSYQMLDDFNAGTTFTLPAPYTLVQVFMTNETFAGIGPGSDEVPIAFLATAGDTAYLVFRGTDTIDEWIQDAKFAQVPYSFVTSGGMTEQGFTEIYATIHEDIVTALNGLPQGSFTKLIITGHSLGGALAVLAAPELNQRTAFAKPTMYNFAGPRVGNPQFADSLYDTSIGDSWRVVNLNDLVPFLPLEIVVIFVNNQPHTFVYEHVNSQQDITFGNPVSGPTDISDIEFNHEMCNYYNSLCGQTTDPAACMKNAAGIHGCNPTSP